MKKIYMLMVALLCGAAAMAQTCTISAEDVAATADGKTTAYVVINLNESEPGTLITAASCHIRFPFAVTIAQVWDEDEEAYVEDITYPAAKKGHDTRRMWVADKENTIQLSAASNEDYFRTNRTTLFQLGFLVNEQTADGEYEINIEDISFANAAGVSVYPQEPFAIKLTVTGGTGINGVNADDVNAPVYNVAGQRVSKAQKGVYIQNGKKVAVK